MGYSQPLSLDHIDSDYFTHGQWRTDGHVIDTSGEEPSYRIHTAPQILTLAPGEQGEGVEIKEDGQLGPCSTLFPGPQWNT